MYDKFFGISDQQPKERFWSVHSAIVSKGKNNDKTKDCAWLTLEKGFPNHLPSCNYDLTLN